MDVDKKCRINAVVSNDVFDDLQAIAKSRCVSMTEVIRRAISLEKWFHEAMNDGARVMIERNGELYEVEFLG